MTGTDRDGVASTLGYRVAGGILAAAVIGAAAWWLWSLTANTRAVNEFVALPPVAGVPVEVSTTGVHTIWAGDGCGGYCPPEAPERYHASLTVGLVGADGPLTLEPVPTDERYMLGAGRQGRAVWTVDIAEPGVYTMERRSDGTIRSPPLLLGAGRGLPTDTWGGVVRILLLGAVAASLVAGVTLRRRRVGLARLAEQRRR